MLTFTKNGHIRRLRFIYRISIRVKNLISRILIRAFLRVLQDLERSLLGLGICPVLSHPVPSDYFTIAGVLGVILRQIPFLDDSNKASPHKSGLWHSRRLDNLYRLFIIRAALQPLIPQPFPILRTQQVSAVIRNRIFTQGYFRKSAVTDT